MKINCGLNLDWYDEDGSLDQAIETRIISKIVKDFSDKLEQGITEKIQSQIEGTIDKVSNKLIEDFISKKALVTNSYGREVESGTIEELLERRFANYWQDKVDDRGSSSSYGSSQTRMEWLIDNRIEKQCKVFSEDLAKEVNKQVTSVMTDSLKVAIGGTLVDKLGIENIVKKLKE